MLRKLLIAVSAVAALALSVSGPAGAQELPPCPRNMKGYANQPPGFMLRCSCAPAMATGSVWGSSRYTTDSSVCNAARHAGAVRPGGEVRVIMGGRCQRFDGSSRNGVTSRKWGPYRTTFAFRAPLPQCSEMAAAGGTGNEAGTTEEEGGGGAAAAAAPCPRNMKGQALAPGQGMRCSCAPRQMAGSVWGSRRYTTDSSVCAAARHAGAVGPGGGVVTVYAGGGCPSFSGSTNNGIRSRKWGPYKTTFAFRRPYPACLAGAPVTAGCDPTFGGKYTSLLRRIRVPGDQRRYGRCRDYGKYSGSSWAGYRNLPPGYWTYSYPHWYIWGRRTR